MQSGVAIVRTAPEQVRNRDAFYPYRFDSYFHYLSGFPEPEAVIVLVAGTHSKSILFCRDKNEEREIWDGFRYGPEAARETFGVDEAHSITRLDELLVQLISNQTSLYCDLGTDAVWDARVMGWINAVKAQSRNGVSAPAKIIDVRSLLDAMRVVKDDQELATMRRAADISSDAHRRAMAFTRPGRHEYEVEAELLHEFRRRGAQAPAYSSIVAGGGNSCVLHYVQNNAELCSGDLLLIDAGCEMDGYAADITRTFPVNGRYSGPQRDIYQLVLAAQVAAIEQVKPGNEWEDPHRAAVKVLVQGMIDLGLLGGSVDGVIESGAYRKFYMHRTGHWLGMDVHDVGEYKHDGAWCKLASGMVLTVEPGCYIRPSDDVAKDFWNIGVRIEDDVVVTASACDVLTSAPKTVADVEAIMESRSIRQ
jgi:Xaa-Pro aminopeptidase